MYLLLNVTIKNIFLSFNYIFIKELICRIILLFIFFSLVILNYFNFSQR